MLYSLKTNFKVQKIDQSFFIVYKIDIIKF